MLFNLTGSQLVINRYLCQLDQNIYSVNCLVSLALIFTKVLKHKILLECALIQDKHAQKCAQRTSNSSDTLALGYCGGLMVKRFEANFMLKTFVNTVACFVCVSGQDTLIFGALVRSDLLWGAQFKCIQKFPQKFWLFAILHLILHKYFSQYIRVQLLLVQNSLIGKVKGDNL